MDQDGELRSELTGQILGFVVSQAIFVAAQLGIPDLLAAGPCQLADLADAVGAHPPTLYRLLLRLLAGQGVLVEHRDGSFTNASPGELLRDTPGSLRDLALATGEGRYAVFAETLRMAQTGQPAFGAVWEEYLAHNPEARARHRRLLAASRQELGRALANDAWADGETVVDVGGGDGVLLETLLRARPGLRGVVFDLVSEADEAACGSLPPVWRRAARSWPAASSGTSPTGPTSTSSPTSSTTGTTTTPGRSSTGSAGRPPDHGRLVVAEEVLAPPQPARVVMLAIGGQELTPGQCGRCWPTAGSSSPGSGQLPTPASSTRCRSGRGRAVPRAAQGFTRVFAARIIWVAVDRLTPSFLAISSADMPRAL